MWTRSPTALLAPEPLQTEQERDDHDDHPGPASARCPIDEPVQGGRAGCRRDSEVDRGDRCLVLRQAKVGEILHDEQDNGQAKQAPRRVIDHGADLIDDGHRLERIQYVHLRTPCNERCVLVTCDEHTDRNCFSVYIVL